MRIISGTLKGKSINFLKNKNTRPLKDSVKESIFNILNHSNLIKTDIQNSNILDLYSGVGSFGIESLSRNAKRVTFIEKDINASNILKENLKKLSIFQKSKIFTDKIENVLSRLEEKFNIFFLDPPFADENYFFNLELIKNRKIFEENHIVIIHREKRSKENFGNILHIIETKQYGRSKIFFGKFI
jgi:16S rRNA (guanine966-N2)-methyltransferase